MTPFEDVPSASLELDRRREPYALATVVWTKGTSSGKAGDKALVTADGTLRGWVGGACAIGTVIRECRAALDEGRPRVLLVGADELAGGDGSRVPRIGRPATCASEGSYEIFIEPRLPRPQLVILGDAPVARTLGALARTVGFEVVVSTKEAAPRAEAHRVVPQADLSDVVIDARTWVVVATMGRWDGKALRAALATDARFVGLVASARRWAKLRRELEAGLGEALRRVRAPVGLDLGPLPHEEIAVAILAELVRDKAASGADEGTGGGELPAAADTGAAAERAG
ncbi:MAG: XdhC/CoxI family protein [Myxococcota bacterium]